MSALKPFLAVYVIWCIATFCHILLGTLKVTNVSHQYLPNNASSSVQTNNTTSSQKQLLYATPIGRLGNQMFIAASLVGVAKDSNRIPALSKWGVLAQVFTMRHPTLTVHGYHPKTTVIAESKARNYNDFKTKLIKVTGPARLCCYLQSWMQFESSFKDVRSMFTIKPHIYNIAQQKLRHISPLNISDTNNITYVGIHVRRGDMLRSIAKYRKKDEVAPLSYIEKAKAYYKGIYSNIHFVVGSDGIEWCQKHLGDNETSFLVGNGFQVDFAVLTQCNHTIISVGTFSWWVGFFTRGDVVYYADQGIPEHTPNISQYIMPTWIKMSA